MIDALRKIDKYNLVLVYISGIAITFGYLANFRLGVVILALIFAVGWNCILAWRLVVVFGLRRRYDNVIDNSKTARHETRQARRLVLVALLGGGIFVTEFIRSAQTNQEPSFLYLCAGVSLLWHYILYVLTYARQRGFFPRPMGAKRINPEELDYLTENLGFIKK